MVHRLLYMYMLAYALWVTFIGRASCIRFGTHRRDPDVYVEADQHFFDSPVCRDICIKESVLASNYSLL